MEPIRAVYEHGFLRLLDPIDLAEGQVIQVIIMSEKERARAALGDLLVNEDTGPDDNLDEASLFAEIDAGITGNPDVSGAIIEERREGP